MVTSGIVFYRVMQAIGSDEAYRPLQKGVKVFIWIYIGQMTARVLGFLTYEGLWVVQNYFRDSTDLVAYLRDQEYEMVLSTVGELLLDFFLVTYIF